MSTRPRLPRIWIITDPAHPDGPVAPVTRALRGCAPGMAGVQLRARHVPDRQLVSWGRELRRVTHDRDCLLTINRRADVAEIVGADGVHLPERALSVEEIRRGWRDMPLIGVSRHDRQGLARAERDEATYAFLSPVFAVPEKNEPMGIEGFEAAIAHVGIPTYALGGISSGDTGALLRAGAFGVAVRRAVYGSDEPADAIRRFIEVFEQSMR